ncbi:ATP-binding cassette domain-containing protein [Candidatus Curtissbacteria bacterium]|nr:ATP-binding cassette domain-containing protein [Candidatus Curtissbacteria bacterium]
MAVIEVKNLTKIFTVYQKEPGILGTFKSLFGRKYEEIKAVDNISFSIEEGELVGFIGPNGAGKTTTLKCLSGLLYPTGGVINVLGFQPWRRKADFLKKIAFVMGQKNQLWWDLPPMETFVLNKEIYGLSDEKFKKVLGDLVDLLDLSDLLKVPVKKLSLGQRMKCELIASLLHSPQVLYLDEPTIGLDVVMQKKLRDFIRDYNHKYKATIMLTSHYMADVEALARRVIIINRGRILFDGDLTSLIKKHAPYKLITLVLKEQVARQKFEKLGKIKKFSYPEVVLKVESHLSNKIAAKILENFPVDDLNIEDADIEEVIREIFQSQNE